jgi:hypothetical protein
MFLLAICVGQQIWEINGFGRPKNWVPQTSQWDMTSSPQGRNLKASIIGKNCLALWGGQFNNPVGSLTCWGWRFYNASAQETQWQWSSNHSEPNPHPLSRFHHLWQTWNKGDTKMVGPGRIILDMWKDHLYQAALVLGQGLCARDNISLLFPPSLTSRWIAGNSRLWGKRAPKEPEGYTKEYTDWKLERWLMAPRVHNSVLWANHLGWGWLLELPDCNIYA